MHRYMYAAELQYTYWPDRMHLESTDSVQDIQYYPHTVRNYRVLGEKFDFR